MLKSPVCRPESDARSPESKYGALKGVSLVSNGTEEGLRVRRTLLCSAPVEDLPGWETRLYLIEYPPGADSGGHHHPVAGLGYMLSGTILSAFAEDQAVSIREGESFVDPAHLTHTVSRNPSSTEPVRFVVAYTVKCGEPVTVLPG
jgi:quercetin dioxygenase-like cupin family protein